MAQSHTEIIASACSMQLMRVETTDGRVLGRVFDLRCRWDPDTSGVPVVDQVIFGKPGLLERVGLGRMKPRSVHWYLVEAVVGNVIVVAASK